MKVAVKDRDSLFLVIANRGARHGLQISASSLTLQPLNDTRIGGPNVGT